MHKGRLLVQLSTVTCNSNIGVDSCGPLYDGPGKSLLLLMTCLYCRHLQT